MKARGLLQGRDRPPLLRPLGIRLPLKTSSQMMSAALRPAHACAQARRPRST